MHPETQGGSPPCSTLSHLHCRGWTHTPLHPLVTRNVTSQCLLGPHMSHALAKWLLVESPQALSAGTAQIWFCFLVSTPWGPVLSNIKMKNLFIQNKDLSYRHSYNQYLWHTVHKPSVPYHCSAFSFCKVETVFFFTAPPMAFLALLKASAAPVI